MNVTPTALTARDFPQRPRHYAHLKFLKSDLVVETPRFSAVQDLDAWLEKIAARGTVLGTVVSPGKTDLQVGSEVFLTLRREGGFMVERRAS